MRRCFCRKSFIFFFLPFFLLIFAYAHVAKADSFSISGTLQETDPAMNNYAASYKLVTAKGQAFYLRLKDDPYKSWIGKEAYFHVKGDFYNFAVRTSGVGVRNNTYTIPKTGAEMYLVLVLAMLAAGGLSYKKRGC